MLSPEAAAGIRQPAHGAYVAGDQCTSAAHDGNGCCRGEDKSGCACTGGEAASTGRVSSSASGIGPRGPGLAKDEYRRLKKAGLLPPKLHSAAEKHAIKNGKATTAGGQATPGGQRPAHGRLGGMVVVYASQTGNAHNLAKDLYEDASEKGFATELKDMAELDIEALVQRPPPLPVVIFISSTWTDGVPPPKAQDASEILKSQCPSLISYAN